MIELIIIFTLSFGSFSLGKHYADKKCQKILISQTKKCYSTINKCRLELAEERCKEFKIAPTDQYKECVERATK